MTAIWQRRAWLLMPMLAVQALSHAYADKQYGPGVSDREIVIGQTMPYSGPLSAFATLGRAQAAYFAMINERGGVNGRKIKLISLDDGYSPPRTVEQTRKLVESEHVLLLFSSLGSPTNVSVLKYNVYGYAAAQIMVHVLERCGDNLTRENVMHHAGSLKDVRLPMLLPGISLNTSATDYDPVKQMQLMRFNGRQWVRFGPVVGR